MLDSGQPRQSATGPAGRPGGVLRAVGGRCLVRPGHIHLATASPRHGLARRLRLKRFHGSNTPLVTYTRGRDLSRSLAGAGGIGGLLARSHGYSGGNRASHSFYHADGNGNVTALVNSSGALVASYQYNPYGRRLSSAGPLSGANVMRFSSKPWVGFYGSSADGLYSYGYPFYDPYLQRWLNRDPYGEPGADLLRFHSSNESRDFAELLPENFNLYAFLRNNPISAYDPYGELVVVGRAVIGKVIDWCVKKLPQRAPTLPKVKPPQKPKPQKGCPPCPPPHIRVDRVPPSDKHYPCPGDHWHIQFYNQTPPPACICKPGKWQLGGCLPQGGNPPPVPWP